MIAIISIIILFVLYSLKDNQNRTGTCSSQNSCKIGYVCSRIGTGGTGICKSGYGIECAVTDDCTCNLVCINKRCEPPRPKEEVIKEEVRKEEVILKEMIKEEPIMTMQIKSQRVIMGEKKEYYDEEIKDTKIDGMIRTVIRRDIGKKDATSRDDEINSDGRNRDGGFDVRSGESTDNNREDRTPYEEKEGIYYCKDRGVIDVCTYSNATIFLLENGNIISEVRYPEKKREIIGNNVKLIRITTYKGYLHGVGEDGRLYTLPNNYFTTKNWEWELTQWGPVDIKHISATHDTLHLWIQTDKMGFIYNGEGTLEKSIMYGYDKRVYGKDVEHYVDIDREKYIAIINPGGEQLKDVYDAAISYHGEIITIKGSDRNIYKGITIVDWKPYYIN